MRSILPSRYREICAECGLARAWHRGDRVGEMCPKHAGWMDWPDPSQGDRVSLFTASGTFLNSQEEINAQCGEVSKHYDQGS